MNEQLIATTDVPGVLGSHLRDAEIIITYPYDDDNYYTVIIYDDNDIHALLINVEQDDLETGDVLVEYKPFDLHLFNYDVVIYIYQQPTQLPLPFDDFDMDEFVAQNNLILLHKIEFMVLQKLETKPNIYSLRYYNQKLKSIKQITS